MNPEKGFQLFASMEVVTDGNADCGDMPVTIVFYNTAVKETGKLNMNLEERTAKDVCASCTDIF